MAAAVASTSIDVSINHAFRTLGTVKALKHELDKDYFDDIEKIFEKAMKDVTERTSDFLCNLHVKHPNTKVWKKMIDMVPLSLKGRNDGGTIPVYEASSRYINCPSRYINCQEYVIPLAKAAIEHNVFEEEERGGLLVENHNTEKNTLQELAFEGQLDTLKELRASNLLMKKDIKAEDLVFHAASSYSSYETLDYLLELDPDALNTNVLNGVWRGLPITHALVQDNGDAYELSLLVEIAMKYHRYDIGLIFQKDMDGMTAIGRAIDISGEEKSFEFLNDYLIPFTDPEVPILHHCAKDAPQLMDTFAKYYPSAIFLRDKYGRTLRQAELASGNKTFAKNAFFFVNITDADLRVADPKDDLYPFMMAASRMDTTRTCAANQTENDDLNDDTNSDVLTTQVPRCDLSAVYYLIKRDPSLAYGGEMERNNRKRKITKV